MIYQSTNNFSLIYDKKIISLKEFFMIRNAREDLNLPDFYHLIDYDIQ